MDELTRKPDLLYIANNDGSDMRVTKEIRSLSKRFDVHYLGFGEVSATSFARENCFRFELVSGSARSVYSIARLAIRIMKNRIIFQYKSIHVVDEQLLATILVPLLGKKVVLDIFDSFFLRINKPGNDLFLIKWILYFFAKKIIVTDGDRQNILASFAKDKSLVVPNVPFISKTDVPVKSRKPWLTLAYFGSLAEARGTAFVRDLLKEDPQIRVLCAGWPADDSSRELFGYENVNYLGVLKQEEANEIVSQQADYIIAIYPEGNLNNYYASPNKIYDAIHTKTPIIIGYNVKVGDFVRDNGLGICVKRDFEAKDLIKHLFDKRESFSISEDLRKRFCWESFEGVLLAAHGAK